MLVFYIQSIIKIAEFEVAVIKGKKDIDIKALIATKETQHINEHSIFYAMCCLNDIKPESEGFNISALFGYMLDLLSMRAHSRKIYLILKLEACFPKEVTGDRTKFEMLIAEIMLFLIDHAKEGEILISATLKAAEGSNFLLSFDITAGKTPELTVENTKKMLDSDENSLNIFRIFGLHIANWKTVLEFLKGSIEVTDAENDNIKLSLDIPFSNCDSSQIVSLIPRLNIFEQEKINEYTTRWSNKKSSFPEVRPEGMIPMSPATRPERMSLRMDPKQGSSKGLIDSQTVKKDLLNRIKKTPVLTPGDASKNSSNEEAKESDNSGCNSSSDLSKKLSADRQSEFNKAINQTASPSKIDAGRKSGFYNRNEDAELIEKAVNIYKEVKKQEDQKNDTQKPLEQNIIINNNAVEPKLSPTEVMQRTVKEIEIKFEEEKQPLGNANKNLDSPVNEKDYEYF